MIERVRSTAMLTLQVISKSENSECAILSGFGRPVAVRDLSHNESGFGTQCLKIGRNSHSHNSSKRIAAIQQRQALALPGRDVMFLQQVLQAARRRICTGA